ncbi:MAG: hypothetical protein NC541_11230 [bacterium]|nr:hypothetical protein [bacterium]MCM1412346.1 hypothetical protein [Lachnospiraceae bacterium]
MKMKIENGRLIVADADSTQYAVIKSWNSMRWNRSRQWLEGPATRELLNKMAGIVRLPGPIEAERQRMNGVQAAVDAERMKDVSEPLYSYPVKIPLFQHQIKGANMALLTFGLIEPPGEEALT